MNVLKAYCHYYEIPYKTDQDPYYGYQAEGICGLRKGYHPEGPVKSSLISSENHQKQVNQTSGDEHDNHYYKR